MANSQKLFEKAEKLLQKEKFDSAREIFLTLFEIEPGNEIVLLSLAGLSLRLGRTEDSVRYNRLLADLYVRRKNLPKAIATCRKILTTSPLDVQTWGRLGSLLKQAKKTAEAVEAFREAATLYRRNGESARAAEYLRQIVELKPANIGALTELAGLEAETGGKSLAAKSLLRAAAIARSEKMEDRWAELAERAHQLDPGNEAGRIAAAEVSLARGHAPEAVALIESMPQSGLEGAPVLDVLCRAYLNTGEYGKAEALLLKLDQARPETVILAEELIRGLLDTDESARALSFAEKIMEQMYLRQEKKAEFLALVEQIYMADENNLQALEILSPLYNELNRESELRISLTRLFSLYLAGEHYGKAAETLERLLDADPYGAGHSDRLLNLEGHIDAIWYSNMAGRISLPGVGRRPAPDSPEGSGDGTAIEEPATLDDLIVEGEMYHRYHLAEKLQETVRKIDRLFPGVHEESEALRDLYELAGFQPAPIARPTAGEGAGHDGAVTAPPLEELSRISAITDIIHRQGTPERILEAAAEQLGRLVNASRCRLALGSPDAAPLVTAEYVPPGVAPSEPAAALKVWQFLMRLAGADSQVRSFDDVSAEHSLAEIAPELHLLGTHSILAISLHDQEAAAGLLLVEQCFAVRQWTAGEKELLRTLASQVMIAIRNLKLRRLVRSLAGTDAATGLLPRSAYLDCLLAEAMRAAEQSRLLSVCLIEPAGADGLSRKLGEAGMRSFLQQMRMAVTSCVRQNDIAIRYGPLTIALCLPDTPLTNSQAVIEKLQKFISNAAPETGMPAGFCAAAGDLYLGPGFDAVDSVTEIVNRLEASMASLRKQQKPGIVLSRFEG